MLLRYTILLCFLLPATARPLQAQTTELQQLHKVLRSAADSVAYVKALNNIAFLHHRTQLDSCLWYASKAFTIAARRNDMRGKSYAYTNFALFHTRKRNYKLGNIYNYKALQLDEALKDTAGICIDYSNLALGYRADENLGKAQYYEQLSLQMSKRFADKADYNIDLLNYLEYYWKVPAKRDSVRWVLQELYALTDKTPYSMEWYEARMYEAMEQLKTTSFIQAEQRINQLAAAGIRRGMPDVAVYGYFHLINDILPLGYPVDSVKYATRIFRLARQAGNYSWMLDALKVAYPHATTHHNWPQLALYGDAIRRLSLSDITESGSLPAVDYFGYFLKEQQVQELHSNNALQQHIIEKSRLQEASHWMLLRFLGVLLLLLLLLAAIYCWSYYHSRRHIRRLAVLHADITEKNIRLQQNDVFKNRLLSLIAHDFRTPLKEIQHNAIRWQQGTPELPAMIGGLQGVAMNARRVLDTFDNILRWVKLQLNGFAFTPAPCDTGALINAAITHLQEEIRQQHLQVVTDIPAGHIAAAHHDMLQSVNRTLLRQLIHLSGENGILRISILRQSQQIRVICCGFPVHTTPAALQAADHPDNLIMATCRDFLQQMQGSLHIFSTAQNTLSFSYLLPVSKKQ
ncbi:HAMP domain-containing histidine kinase [Chitinophaga sp. Mgbs1]|uniref:HAMP domain-containing histidine kinase n=1 Tax=Chitinophaga solisilvae TaxID=1233460 RepID=A0A3S1JJ44_9BACT|nr:HAMP domain-containing histidine kinase [Chitinophaga solisilvae]